MSSIPVAILTSCTGARSRTEYDFIARTISKTPLGAEVIWRTSIPDGAEATMSETISSSRADDGEIVEGGRIDAGGDERSGAPPRLGDRVPLEP